MAQSKNTSLYKDFVKTMEALTRRHDHGKVFNDFLTVSICSYHKTNIQTQLRKKDQENEALYMGTIKKYEKEELSSFAKLLGLFNLAANDDPYSDILGQYFTEHVTMGANGQFFTPTSVCEMMALMQGEPRTIEGKSVADPACGSGRLLLAFAKHNPNNTFFATDSFNSCAKMATLNFFINGLRGEVAWMNTLSMEWYGGWHINNGGLGILPIDKEQSLIWSASPKTSESPKVDLDRITIRHDGQGEQLKLF